MKKTLIVLLLAVVQCLAAGAQDQTGVCAPFAGYLSKAGSYPFIVVDKQAFRLSLVDSLGYAIKEWGIACAKNYGPKQRRGDHKTPEGVFKINELLYAKGIPHDFRDGKGPVKDAYGPWFLRLDVPGFWDIGIHGTPFPESIGSRATEGCVRMRNEDIVDLKERVKLGTVVIILPDPVGAE